mmetsp:Transcript_5372/g.8261  ORF Transcript_5372/g.8261 Transcript_5372/m.8261 type:complete len:291 (+) Transcript_5372:267-1139(+)
MFRKRRRNAETKLEDLSQRLVPIYSKAPCAFLIHNLFSSEECTHLIRRAKEAGFEKATVEGPDGDQITRRDIRSCGRCIIDDDTLADSIFEKIQNAIRGKQPFEGKVMHAPWVSSSSKASVQHNNIEDNDRITAVGLNERLRFMKYTKGHFFAPHQDIAFTRGSEFGDEKAGETSHITVQIYLNDKFKGGTTRFVCGQRYYDVQPRKGSALIFDHDLLHEATLVTRGQKYSVRTDIMFKRDYNQIIPLKQEMAAIPEATEDDTFPNVLRTPNDTEDDTRIRKVTFHSDLR